MIDSTFVDAITQNARTEVVEIRGREYATKAVVNPPLPFEPLTDALAVATLTALVDFCAGSLGTLLHVRSYHEVALLSEIQGEARKRENFITANCGAPLFKFNQFLPHSEFMIGLQSLFQDYGDRAKVMKIVGTIREDKVRTSADDGVTQHVTASAGIALSQEVALPNPVMLRPYRTFSEIEQPPSSFVLRVKEGNAVALFEADGGRWKHEAITAIREYLASKITGRSIVA